MNKACHLAMLCTMHVLNVVLNILYIYKDFAKEDI